MEPRWQGGECVGEACGRGSGLRGEGPPPFSSFPPHRIFCRLCLAGASPALWPKRTVSQLCQPAWRLLLAGGGKGGGLWGYLSNRSQPKYWTAAVPGAEGDPQDGMGCNQVAPAPAPVHWRCAGGAHGCSALLSFANSTTYTAGGTCEQSLITAPCLAADTEGGVCRWSLITAGHC